MNYTDHLGNIRLIYTTDPFVLGPKILEENNYYPFGLKHGLYNKPARDFRPVGIVREVEMVDDNPYNYKYNGKEFQNELGLNYYDYGARNYMPDIGRFYNVDRLSEKYEMLSPFTYVANNPTRFIDINGEWIYIESEGGKRYRYDNGMTQHQINGQWTVVDETVNLSNYVLNIIAGLDALARSGNTGYGVIDYFSNDQKNVLFKGVGKNNINRGGTIIVNKKFNGHIAPIEGNKIDRSPFYLSIAHELAHRIDQFERYSGNDVYAPWSFLSDGQIVRATEKFATHIENMIRSESGLPLRTHYAIDENNRGIESTRIIDNDGNSLFFNQLNPSIYYNYQEGIILNERKTNKNYNYRKLNPVSTTNSKL